MSQQSRNTGRLPQPGPTYDQAEMIRLVNSIERSFILLGTIIQEGYTATNVTTTRTLDADTATLAEVADVLGTLIEDMKVRGYLGK
jgi:hypothetical protein